MPYVWVLLALAAGARAASRSSTATASTASPTTSSTTCATIMYEHLTRLSFSFYDRVQSGQLISRANSDIRSVQMFLAFAPLMVAQHRQLRRRLRAHADDQRAAHARGAGAAAVRLRRRRAACATCMFPLSWIVQARTADVATIVDENVTGVRVVKSFAAEQPQIDELAAARPAAAVGVGPPDRRPGPLRAAHGEPAPPRLAAVLLYGGMLAIDGAGHDRHARRVQRLRGDAAGAVPHARVLHDDAASGPRPRPAASTRSSTSRPRSSTGRAPSTSSTPRARSSSATSRSATRDGPPVLDGFDAARRAGRDGRARRPHRLRQVDGRPAAPPLLRRRRRARCCVDGHDVRDLTLASLRRHVGMVLDEPFLFSASVRDNIAYGRPDAADRRGRRRGASRPGRRVHRRAARRLRHASSASAATRCRAASASASPSPARCSSTRAILVLDDATSAIDVQVEEEIHDALATLMQGRTTHRHRPPAVDHRPGRPGRAARGRPHRGRRHPRRAAWPPSPATPRCWPTSRTTRRRRAGGRRGDAVDGARAG